MDSIGRTRIVNWISDENEIFLNPRLSPKDRAESIELIRAAPALNSHLWIQSSGSTGGMKWVALSKKSFLIAADGANQHLEAGPMDRWGLVLPTFHVGGLSILARATLAGSKVSRWEKSWNAREVFAWIQNERISLLSVVPTQLFDLVSLQKCAPSSLRAVIVGGAALEKDLEESARELGWPLFPSFGMTELCSQIATATANSAALHLLPHLEARVNQGDADQKLWIKSEALMTGTIQKGEGRPQWEPPKLVDGFWQSSDRAELKGRILIPLGRDQDFIKIRGEGVNLNSLRERFGKEAGLEVKWVIVPIPSAREGYRLYLITEGEKTKAENQVSRWNANCFPVERIQAVIQMQIPRSDLGKVLWSELAERVSRSISDKQI